MWFLTATKGWSKNVEAYSSLENAIVTPQNAEVFKVYVIRDANLKYKSKSEKQARF